MFCGYCEDHGGAAKGTPCPACGRISASDEEDTHLQAPCDHCGEHHAVVFCREYNRLMGMEPLYGYEVGAKRAS